MGLPGGVPGGHSSKNTSPLWRNRGHTGEGIGRLEPRSHSMGEPMLAAGSPLGASTDISPQKMGGGGVMVGVAWEQQDWKRVD